jgi:hypothetical protein
MLPKEAAAAAIKKGGEIMDNKLLAAAILLGIQNRFHGTEHQDYINTVINHLIDLMGLHKEIEVADIIAQAFERPMGGKKEDDER